MIPVLIAAGIGAIGYFSGKSSGLNSQWSIEQMLDCQNAASLESKLYELRSEMQKQAAEFMQKAEYEREELKRHYCELLNAAYKRIEELEGSENRRAIQTAKNEYKNAYNAYQRLSA